MQSKPGNNLIERVLEWIRGVWAGSGDRQREPGSDAIDQARTPSTPAAQTEPVPGTQRDDVAANGSSQQGVASPTGASEDEYATGGYTGDNPTIDTVEEAAEPLDEAPDVPDPQAGDESLTDQRMDGPTPDSPNYGVGNLELGSQGSLGTETPPEESGDFSPDDRLFAEGEGEADTAPVDAAVAMTSDEPGAAVPGSVGDGPDESVPGLGGTTGDDALSTIDEMDVRGIGDLGAEELGSLEELEDEAIAFEKDASERFDQNSEPGFSSDVPDSLADIDHETDDYASSALQDAGLRIVDEDAAGLTLREPGDNEFVDPGSVVDEPAMDTGDARPLSDFTQERSGIASESDEPTGAAGDRSTGPFGSETGMDTPETWMEDGSAAEPGADADLAAMDTGSTVGGGTGLDVTGLFVTSDIDVADLSYLDESENARFDFSDPPAGVPTSDDRMPEMAGAGDDIGASPTGVRDTEGAVESEVSPPEPAEPVPSTGDSDIPDSAAGVADDIADSPSGVVDAGDTTQAIESAEHSPSGARANIPSFATDKDSDPDPAGARSTDLAKEPVTGTVGSGPGGSVRGDETGSCPADFPIKGNSSSKIYHVPGIPSHQGTKAEWCFATEEQAQAAGYRPPGQRNRGGGRSSSGPNPDRDQRSRGSSSR